jgi:hypothetical protein
MRTAVLFVALVCVLAVATAFRINYENASDKQVLPRGTWLGGRTGYGLADSEFRINYENAADRMNNSPFSDAQKFKLGKTLKKIGKGALKVGKAYVGQKYGIQLSDIEEALSEKKIKIDEIFDWVQKGKQIYDIFKTNDAMADELLSSEVNLDEIFEFLGKAKRIHDIFKNQSQEEMADHPAITFIKTFWEVMKPTPAY